MKYLLIAILSSPFMLAYELKPLEMQEALTQALRFVLNHIVG
ncbi:hypothetical protein [Trinickia sp.]